jgi:hypothetical protein
MAEEDTKDDLTTDDQVKAEDQTDGEETESEDTLDLNAEDGADDDDGFTEEDMRLLSDEERAALLGEDENGEGDDPDADEAGEVQSQEAQGAEEAQEGAGDIAEDDQDKAAPASSTQIMDLSVFDTEMDTLEKAKEAAFDDWEEGNLTREEYMAKVKEVDNQSKDLIAEKAVLERQNDQVLSAFMNTAGEYFKAYPELADATHKDNFNLFVEEVTADPRMANKTHQQMLEKAHRLYAADALDDGIEVPALKSKATAPKAEAKADLKPAPKPAPKKRAGDKAPRTLANVPAAQQTSVSDGKYSALAQRLKSADAFEYERIIDQMPPEEAEAFASMDV